MAEESWHFTEPPILPELVPPPISAVRVRGAQLVQIYGPPHPDPWGRPKPDGGREAVILAWAAIPGGGWAVLLAWTSYALVDLHATALARFGWYRLDAARVQPKRPPSQVSEGFEWTGWHPDSQINVAVRAAALLLPEEMRAAAVVPRARRQWKPRERGLVRRLLLRRGREP